MNRSVLRQTTVGVGEAKSSLAISQLTAQKQILGLIAEGRILLSLDISSRGALRSAEQRERQWVQFAIAIFERMFEDDAYSRKYLKFQSRIVGALSLEQERRYFGMRIQECISQLESDFEQVRSLHATPKSPKLPDKQPHRRRGAAVISLSLVAFFAALFAGLHTSPPWRHASSPRGSLHDQLDYLKGTGWILVGDYDMERYRWTWGPLFDLRDPSEQTRNVPWAGDVIRLRSNRHVVVVNWASEKSHRQLEAPAETSRQIRPQDLTPVTLSAGSLLRVADVHWGDTNAEPASVWVRVTLPNP